MELVLLNFPIKAAFRRAFLTPRTPLSVVLCIVQTYGALLSGKTFLGLSPSPLWSGSSLTYVCIAPALDNFDSFSEVFPLCVSCFRSQSWQGHLELSKSLSLYSPFWPSSPQGPLQSLAVGRGKTSPGFKCCSWNSPVPLLSDGFESWSTSFITVLQLQVEDPRNCVTAVCSHSWRKNKDYTLDAQA